MDLYSAGLAFFRCRGERWSGVVARKVRDDVGRAAALGLTDGVIAWPRAQRSRRCIRELTYWPTSHVLT